jgi:release factor glutamine methyltransferase
VIPATTPEAERAAVEEVGAATIPDVVRRSTAYLERHGVQSPRATAETLLMHLLGTDRAGLYTRPGRLDGRTAKLLGRALCRRCSGTPVQHLTGEQQFLDLVLRVEPGVFVPRLETEVLAVAALTLIAEQPRPLVVDVGTGTGAVALAVKSRRPDAEVLATDRSADAVALARWNAERLGLAVRVLEGDLLEPLPAELRGRVDLIVSNPPYLTEAEYRDVPLEVRADPRGALVGGTTVHRRLASGAPGWLQAGGALAVEIGEGQGSEVRTMFEAWSAEVRVLPDLTGRDRVVVARTPA